MAVKDGYVLLPGAIKGVDEAIAVLEKVKEVEQTELPKDARGQGRSVAADVMAAFPGSIVFIARSPTGNPYVVEYDVNAVADTDDSSATVDSVGHEDEQIPLFRVVVTGTNATFADMGKQNFHSEPARVQALDYLDRVTGGPSRFAWAVADRSRSAVNNSLQRHSRRKESDYTKALAEPSE